MKKTIILLSLIFVQIVFANDIFINRVKLNSYEIASLNATYGYVESGRYWYDSVAGLWGYENGPTVSKAVANIYFRGKLPSDISGRGTGMYINGREIHYKDKQYLESIYGVGNVKRGRYWLNQYGQGGYEGGVAFFQIPRPKNNSKKRKFSLFSTRDLVGGSVINGAGFIGTDGTSATW